MKQLQIVIAELQAELECNCGVENAELIAQSIRYLELALEIHNETVSKLESHIEGLEGQVILDASFIESLQDHITQMDGNND